MTAPSILLRGTTMAGMEGRAPSGEGAPSDADEREAAVSLTVTTGP